MRRFIRKHQLAFLALAVYHFVFFFPVMFMARVVSPDDVFNNYEPWSIMQKADVQNALLNDPPTAYLTVMELMKNHREAFHWNPYVGSGIPGVGSSAAALLSPFVLVPTLLLPLSWVYTVMIFLKLNVAFWCAYMWLREEGAGKRGSAIGAIVVAAAGVYAVRWLWQITNATALYPALLWIIRRTWNHKRTPIWVVAIVVIAYALTGFPAAMAYGAWLCIAYVIYLTVRYHRIPINSAARFAIAIALALLITAPSLVPFVQLLRRSGYLATRATLSARVFFPDSHWRSFFRPDRLGNPALKNWAGAKDLGAMNNYVESTVYVGVLAIAFAVFGPLARRARDRWFWLGALIVILGAIFGKPPMHNLLGALPGFKYSALTRAVLLLPLPAGYLAACGASWLLQRRWKSLIAAILVIASSAELARFAGRFYPYLPIEQTGIPQTPTIAFLKSEAEPFRIAPFFNYLWPNSSEYFQLEDIRSHFGSEADYRTLLQRVDPQCWGGESTVLHFNGLSFNYRDPIVGMLGVRYLIEQPAIDIIKWSTFAETTAGVQESGAVRVPSGGAVIRSVPIDAEPFYAIEIPMAVDGTAPETARATVTAFMNGKPVYERSFTPLDINAMNKIYVPVVSYAHAGDVVTLRIASSGMALGLLRGATTPGQSPIYYGRVKTPIVFDRMLPDGRIFRNLAEVPRFHAVQRVSRMTLNDLLGRRDIDFASEAVITDPKTADVQGGVADVKLVHYLPAEQRVATNSARPFFLASSEKLTPELAVSIDGRRVKPVQINGLFAGVPMPAGRHTVVFSRRIGRGWWWPSLFAAIALVAISIFESAALRHDDDLVREKRAPDSRDPREQPLPDAQDHIRRETTDDQANGYG